MKTRLGLLVSVVSVLAALSGVAEARTRALVVGVSGYPALPETTRLKGPRNNSREVANTLVKLGVPAGDVTVLADGVERLADGISAPGPGNKAAILAELDRLADTSESGDLVVFYFSGHGAQQPDRDGDEQGGNDEIILPYDIGSWTGKGVENALVDDELNERVGRILDKGADFFGIIDACHSATGFRAVDGDDILSRQVDPEALGIPASEMVESEPRALLNGEKTSTPGRGRAAFFYAAQETEKALEKIPTGGEPGESFGVFTYSMLRRLNENPNVTYRTLHQAVMADIKRNSLMATQTPELEGELLDEPALRITNAQPLRQWPTFGGKLQAGQIDGLSAGTIVGLYEDPADPQEKVLAYGEVEQAGATRSLIVPVAYPCGEPLDAETPCPVDEAAFKKGRFARVIEPGVDLSIVLSEPLRVDPNDGFDYGPTISALESAVASQDLSAQVSVKKSGYDVAVALIDGKLAFSSSAGQIDANGPGSSPRLTLPDNPQAATATVAGAVNRIAKAMALQRLGGGAEAEEKLGFASKVLVAKQKKGASADGACADSLDDYDIPIEAGDMPRVENCDVLSVSMTNQGTKPLDVTVLLVGADFSITPLWPNEGDANRINTGETKTVDLLRKEPGPEPASEQRLIFVTVPGVGKSHAAFTNLEQEGLRAVPDEEGPVAEAREYIDAGLNDMSRSVTAQPARIEEEMSISVKPFYVGE